MRLFYITFLIIVITISCSQNSTEPKNHTLTVSLRMEVKVLDSLTHMYPKQFTLTHLYSAIQTPNGQLNEIEYSDTTTCRNGWAVKELNHILNQGEKIILGATTYFVEDQNYNITEVTYNELFSKKDVDNYVRYVKTFNIYE